MNVTAPLSGDIQPITDRIARCEGSPREKSGRPLPRLAQYEREIVSRYYDGEEPEALCSEFDISRRYFTHVLSNFRALAQHRRASAAAA